MCEKESLEGELKQLTEKYRNIKQEYLNLCNINLQKDIVIRKIKQRIENSKFNSFGLSKECLHQLRSISNDKKEDSQFVSVILYELYKDSETISKLCISNRVEENPQKKLISIENLTLLKRVFDERLQYCANNTTRKNSLNKCIRNAIDNAKRKR